MAYFGQLALASGWVVGTLRFAAILAFYALTAPENHYESWDAYWYALGVQQYGLIETFDTRSILYHVVNRLIFVSANALGSDLTSYAVIQAVSVVSAALSLLLLVRLLTRGFAVSELASWLTAGTLGVSYGFWRYAAEAELYAPSAFLILAVLNLIFDADNRAHGRWPSILPAALLAGAAVLYYQPNSIPLFLAIPVLFLARDRLGWLVAYGAFGSAVVVLGYVVAYLVSQPDPLAPLAPLALIEFVASRSSEFNNKPLRTDLLVQSVVSAGHTILSTNWIYGIDEFAEAIAKMQPWRPLKEEIYAAAQFRPFVYLPVIILPALVAALLWALWRAIGAGASCPFNRRIAFSLVWLAVFAAVVGWLQPGGFESKILMLLPLAVLFAIYVVEPCVSSRQARAPAVLLILILLYNTFGGMGIVQSSKGDYLRAKAAWLIANATQDDLVVLIGEDGRMEYFIRYAAGTRVVVMSGPARTRVASSERVGSDLLQFFIDETRERCGRVFVFDEFFTPSEQLAARAPLRYAYLREVAAEFSGRERLVFSNDVGQTYEITLEEGAARRPPEDPCLARFADHY